MAVFLGVSLLLIIITNLTYGRSAVIPGQSGNKDGCRLQSPAINIVLNSSVKSNQSAFNTFAINWKNIPGIAEGDWIGVWSKIPPENLQNPVSRINVNEKSGHVLTDIRWGRKFFKSIPKTSIMNIPQCFQYWIAYIRMGKIILESCFKLRQHWMQQISKDVKELKLADLMLPGVIQSHSRHLNYPKLNQSPWYELVLGARYLKIIVSYDKTYGKFITKQEKKVSLIKYLNQVYKFVEQTQEIVILEIISTNVDDYMLRNLEDVIVTMLHELLVPKHLEPNPSVKLLWQLDKRLIISCSQIRFSKFVWKGVTNFSYAHKITEKGNDSRYYGSDSLWSLQIDDTISTSINRGLNNTFQLSSFLESSWKSINILAIPCIPCTNIMEVVIEANQKKPFCPENKQMLRLLNKSKWRQNKQRFDFSKVCKENSDATIKVWPTVKAQPELMEDELIFRLIKINWLTEEIYEGDLIALFDEDPKSYSMDISIELPQSDTNINTLENTILFRNILDPSPEESLQPLYVTRPFATEGEIVTTVTYGRPTVSVLSRGGCVGPWAAFIRDKNVIASRCISAYPNWMWDNRAAIGNTALRSLVIAGSHNSGSYEQENILDAVSSWVVCQDEDVMNQLLYGVRYFDLRVGYYPETEQLMWINHNMVQWLALEEVLNDIKAFVSISPDPIIIDIHRTPVGFQNEEAPRLLVSQIYATLGPHLVPSRMGQNVTAGDMWQVGKTVILSYGSPWMREEFPWLWPPIFQAWADAKILEDLRNYIDQKMKVEPKRDQIWAAMGHLTPSMWDIILKTSEGVRGMADETGIYVTTWLKERWEKTANILATDFILSNDVIHESIKINLMKHKCPDFLTTFQPQVETTSTDTNNGQNQPTESGLEIEPNYEGENLN